MLKNTDNKLSLHKINAMKAKGIIGSEVFFYKELSSTFDKIKELPLKNGLTVVCARQSNGSGRLGRTWESGEGGIYFTFALTNPYEKYDIPFITLVCALGVCLALNEYVSCSIKWPNDIVCGGKKLCGILTKNLVTSAKVDAVLAGIGINANNSFGVGLPYASSIKDITGTETDENKLLSEVLNSINKIYYDYSMDEVLTSYKKLCINLNREVTLVYKDKEVQGICKDILPDGSMLFDNGKEEFAVYSGEVSVKGIYGKKGTLQ